MILMVLIQRLQSLWESSPNAEKYKKKSPTKQTIHLVLKCMPVTFLKELRVVKPWWFLINLSYFKMRDFVYHFLTKMSPF